jgi:hypothetical protein
MKKLTIFLLLIFCTGVFLAAEDDYKLIKRLQVGPGSIYSYYEVPSRPWKIHVTEIDLTNPFISLETVKSRDKMYGFERVSSMSARNDSAGHRVVMGVNGDFYNTSNGVPINNQVSNGEFIQGYTTWGVAFSYSDGGVPDINTVRFSGKVLSQNSSGSDISYSLSAVNTSRGTDQLVIFNDFFGSSTSTNQNGYECLAHAITEWVVNDTVFAVIEACEDSIGNMSLPQDKFVLSGHGNARDFLLQNCQVGDTVRIIQKLADSPERLMQLVGGGPWFLQNGVDVISPTDVTRHPRTGVGYSEDKNTLYLMVVDGRSTESIGMDYHHMSDFFKFVGAWNAMNLDGGGSSTFVVRNSVMNDPSDGDERTVANSMLCISSAPNSDFKYLQTARDSIAIYKNKSANLEFSGWDEYYNPTGIPDWSQLTVSYDTGLGAFSENIFTAYEQDGDAYITAEYNGEKDSVKVHIIELYDLDIYPEAVTIDSVNGVSFEVRATDEHHATMHYSNDIFEFTVLDPAIASVDANGAIIGKASGETKVIVRYGDQRDTALVSVEIGEGEVVVDEIESIDTWSISGDNYINMSGTSMSLVDRTAGTGSKAVKVDYERTGSEDGMITIACDPVNIYGVPSYILVDVLADSQKNWIYIDLQDARGVDYSVKCSSSLRYKDDYRTQYLDMANLLPADGEQLYPLKITGIRLRIDDKATTGSMYIDRIRLIYPGWTATDDDPAIMIPSGYCLHQNYPNPFNPSTTINYEIPEASRITLDVFDMNGRLVKTLYKGYRSAGAYQEVFSADQLTSGVYFYRLTAGAWTDTKKMLIIK